MARWILLLLLLLSIAGCGGGAYNIPPEEYQRQVQTLGVLPLMFDEGSVIRHPQREEIIRLVRRANTDKAVRLIERLREQKLHFDVRPVEGDPRRFFRRLGVTGTLHGKGAERHRVYAFDPESVRELANREVADALLVVIEYGAVRQERRWDRLHLNYLKTDYNSLLSSAAIVLPTGEIVWEYRMPPGEVFLPLQYPDFDEAHYNFAEKVRTKFISVPGLERRLTQKESGLFDRRAYSPVYRELFDRILKALKPKNSLIRPASDS